MHLLQKMKAKGTLKEYRVIGRKMPTESEPVTPLYRWSTFSPRISPYLESHLNLTWCNQLSWPLYTGGGSLPRTRLWLNLGRINMSIFKPTPGFWHQCQMVLMCHTQVLVLPETAEEVQEDHRRDCLCWGDQGEEAPQDQELRCLAEVNFSLKLDLAHTCTDSRYDSRSGTHNMYREYRDLTVNSAITQVVMTPSGAHFFILFFNLY